MGFLTGKTAIITGAGRAILKDGSCGSIGYGIATAYAKEGANLVIAGRNVKKLEAAKQELESLYGIKVLTVQADVCAGGDNEATVQMWSSRPSIPSAAFRCSSTMHRLRPPACRWPNTPPSSSIWPSTPASTPLSTT
mgnify:FL=1